MTNEHALINPSSFSRIRLCPAILAYKKFIPLEQKSSPAADLGTLKHKYAHHLLLEPIFPSGLPLISPEDMDHVMAYVNYVKNLPGEKFYERKVEYNSFVWGTPDAFIFTHNHTVLQIIDFKSGRIPVDVKNNKQLALYALAILKSFPQHDKVKSIIGTIVQPTINNTPTSHEYSLDELEETVDELTHIILDFTNGVFKFAAGEQCTYCEYKSVCPTFLFHAEIVPGNITADFLNTHLTKISPMEQWLDELKASAIEFLEGGGELKDFKLTNRTMREWKDEYKLIDYLKANNIMPLEDIYTKKIKTVSQMEKLLPFTELKNFIEEKKTANFLKRK